MRLRNNFIKNVEIGELMETLFISSVSGVFFVRFLLYFTGYPQLGSGTFHIAHMLWGGILMFIALVVLLGFLGNGVLRLAAIIGGLGFGIFIDELGKFITRDNNYFFQPTIALLYAIFLILFFTTRYLQKFNRLNDKEYLMNSLQLFEEAVLNDMEESEKQKLLSFLDSSGFDSPVAKELKNLANCVTVIPERKPSILSLFIARLEIIFNFILESVFLARIVLVLYLLQTLFVLIRVLLFLLQRLVDQPMLVGYGTLILIVLSLVIFYRGAKLLKKSKMRAYLLIKQSVLFNIFITQFFLFYFEQFSALWYLVVNLFVLTYLNRATRRK